MPKKQSGLQEQSDEDALCNKLGLVANLLGLLATKDMREGDKISTLEAAGFRNYEIARLLGKNQATVDVVLSQRRKRERKEKRRK